MMTVRTQGFSVIYFIYYELNFKTKLNSDLKSKENWVAMRGFYNYLNVKLN